MYACRLQIASVPFAKCKRVVCKLQACRLQFASRLFCTNFQPSKSKLFSMQIARLSLQIASVPFAISNRVLFFVKALTPFSPRITHPRAAKGWHGLPRVGSGCQGLAELPRSAEGCQGLPGVAGAAKGWQGLPMAVSGVPHHDGHTYQPLSSLRRSAAARKGKERNSLEAEARRIANVDFCLEVRFRKVRVNKFALITNSCIRGPKGWRGALSRPSSPPSFAHSIHPVWPMGTQYNARVTFTYFCAFVLLPFANNSITFAKRVRIQTGINGVQQPVGNNISDGLNEFKRSAEEFKWSTKT